MHPLRYLINLLLLYSIASFAVAAGLNDTGITRCGSADGSSNNLDCPVAGAPGQDAESGRDVTHNDPSDGHAGFSFTKLDANGNPLPASATTWACVKDNVTGLIWEVKTDDNGLRDKDWEYTWYNPNPATNGGNAGKQNGGTCQGARCDTEGYVQAVNAQGLCGAKDWRLPKRMELMSIVNNARSNPSIDIAYFPNTPGTWFWSSSPHADASNNAWNVSFSSGDVDGYLKDRPSAVRLVRAGQ